MAWIGEGRLVLSLEENGLVVYDAHLKQLRPLIENGGPRPGELPPFLLSADHDDPSSIVMQWEDPSEPGYPAVYRVDATKGISTKIIGAWRPVVRWYAAPDGTVALGEGFDESDQILFGRREDGGWQQISKRNFFKGPAHGVLAVEVGSATALVLAPHDGDTRALWRMHTITGDFIKKLAEHERYDIGSALIDPVSDLTIGASYWEHEREEIVWAGDSQAEYETIASRLGSDTIELVSASRDGRRKLYRQWSTKRPIRYAIYDAEEDTLTQVPELPVNSRLPDISTSSVSIKVDGMKAPMNAILNHPPGGPTGKAVVLVHGGPVKRVRSNYSAKVSWLAANGYSVLEPNFRGSSGFGETWRRAGYGEWGRDMQKDVRRSAEWLVERGFAAKGRMCVMGGSYGGYAAMMSAIMDDDLFACAVSLNGVSSIPHLIDYLETRRFRDLTIPRIKGRLKTRTLKRRSPLYRVDLVRIPLLLLHATKDQNVPFEHGALMAKALRKEGKEHELIILRGAEHVLKRAEDKRIYMKNALEFMDKHIAHRQHTSLF
jgi:acetyl esterase/lipase